MRRLIDTYIRAEGSEKVSAFDDLSLVQLIVDRGADAVKAMPEGIRKNKEAVAEAIENNVRKLIIDEQPINPKYYEKMSELLDALIKQRKQEALDYAAYLAKIVELTKQVKNGPSGTAYPQALNTSAKRALYDMILGQPLSHPGRNVTCDGTAQSTYFTCRRRRFFRLLRGCPRSSPAR